MSSLPELSEGVNQQFFVESAAISFPVTVEAGTNDTIKVDGATLTLAAKEYSQVGLISELQDEIQQAGIQLNVEVLNGKLKFYRSTAFNIEDGTNAFGLVAGAATEKITGNFALLAGMYAENQTLNHNATIAYVGTTPPAGNSLAQVKAHVDMLTGINNQYSGYVSVVAAPELGYVLPGRSELYFTNGVVTYAALVTGLKAESATTNKRVYGVAGIHYNLSLRQLNALTGNKFVTFRLKNNQVYVTDGCTTAPDYYLGGVKQSSDFARLSTLRITQAAAQLIRELTEPYIGEPNRMPQYNSLNATIKAGLESMKTNGAIMDYRFTVVAETATLNGAVITLELVPAFELKRVTVNVSLKPPYTTSNEA
ncbi:hypothetical protein QO179_24750 [Bacillus stercoris]|nr:hypothetical protein [Bacillus stercoris]